ncbi:MAG: hypothetical protein JO297_10830, partial [Nitrososphaeraceae archaeon]|nr:hypothetical protein [Nitrososphaeraceae archaeon]
KGYTKDALLLQDLLRYSQVVNKHSFKKRELYNWVVRHNKEIVDYYNYKKARGRNTTYNNRVHGYENRLDNNVKTLKHLRLISKTGTAPAQKIAAQVDLFKYTKGGILLTLILKSIDLKAVMAVTRNQDKVKEHKKELDTIYENIYKLVDSALRKKESPSSNIFYLILYQKCKGRGIFYKVVERIHYIIDSNEGIADITDLLYRALNAFDLFDKRLDIDLVETFRETIENLDENVKELFLYRMKMFTEGNFEYKLEYLGTELDSKQYEEFRFDIRSDYEHIAVRGYCENCKSNQNLKVYYLDLISSTGLDHMRANCYNCNGTTNLNKFFD